MDKTRPNSAALPGAHAGEQNPQDKTYNVYGEEIDPANQMPLNPNQLPHPDQKVSLSTEREPSSILKGGTKDATTWMYPSPQMFYNALKRKGKGDDVDEKVAQEIVGIHNAMNERTWNEIHRWEALHRGECDEEPRLSRFMGRPEELSPRAWLAHKVLGWDKPFDRHDWFVRRCGREVRYVIDYYHDERRSDEDRSPAHKRDFGATKSISVTVRPALDSPGAAWDRIRGPVLGALGLVESPPVVVRLPAVSRPSMSSPSSVIPGIELPSECPASHSANTTATPPKPNPTATIAPDLDRLSANEISKVANDIQIKCRVAFDALQNCATNGQAQTPPEIELQCERAGIALFHCVASRVCPPEAEAFAAEPGAEGAFERMKRCVARFERRAGEVRTEPVAAAPSSSSKASPSI